MSITMRGEQNIQEVDVEGRGGNIGVGAPLSNQ